MNKKALTKVMTALVVVALTVALAGCHFTVTTTNTETTTDANGNTTSTTTTTVNDNGNVTTSTTTSDGTEAAESEPEHLTTRVTFANTSAIDINELYLSSKQADNWGDEMLGDEAPLQQNEMISYNVSYLSGVTFDVRVVVNNEFNESFEDIDFSIYDDPENVTIAFVYDEEANDVSLTIG